MECIGSALTVLRIEEVLSRHAEATSTSLPGAQIRIHQLEPTSQNGPHGMVASTGFVIVAHALDGHFVA
ncbi:hypothetical protein GCK32_009961 [Trichostrongylus colubriformis]|uniref:Uncharacterized protein n=1 Tax=Trichostrongylus colubriformis TaxID=6319 RepID=A0AAN8IHC2_TRICO